MKYKNQLIIPTAIALSLSAASLKAEADEIEETENTSQIEEATQATEIDTNQPNQGNNIITDVQAENDQAIEKDESSDDTYSTQDIESDETISPDVPQTEEEPEISDNPEKNSIPSNDDLETATETAEDSQVPEETSSETGENQDVENETTDGPPAQPEEEEFENNSKDTSQGKIKNSSQKQDEVNGLQDFEKKATKDSETVTKDDSGNQKTSEEKEFKDDNSSQENDKTNSEIIDTEDEDQKSTKVEKEEENTAKPPVISKKDETHIDLQTSSLKKEKNAPKYSKSRYATRIKSKNNSGLYSPVTSSKGISAKQFNDSTLFISEKAVYNGNTYYKVHNHLNGSMQGWMKSNDLNLFNLFKENKHNKKYSVKSTNKNSYLLSDPWGGKNQQLQKLSTFSNNTFNASKHIKVGALNYYYGKIGNRYGWLQDTKLTKYVAQPKYSKAKHATRIKNNNNSGIYSPVTSSKSISAKAFNSSTLFVNEKAVYEGETYYKIHNNLNGAMQGWMKAKDLNVFNMTPEKKHNKKYSIKSSSKNNFLLSAPYGDTNQRLKRLNTYGSVFNATKHIKIGALNYYYGKIGNTSGWLQDTSLTKYVAQPKYSKARHATRIKNNNNSGIYSPVTSSKGVSAKAFNSSTLFVNEKAVYKGETYYKIHNKLNGAMQGWMKAKDLNVFNMTPEKKHNKKYSIKSSSKNNFLLSDPYGDTNQRLKRLNSYGSVFNTTKHIKVGALNYYYGKIGNTYGWLQDTSLTKYVANKPVTKTVKYKQSLNSVLNTQMSLGAKPQAWNGNGGWRNATRNEVKQFVDTTNHKGGAWDYTFLNLNQSQGIAASTLNNKLLGNRGILTKQGSAFTQASKTHGVNEVYLISHAILETGHGQSQLAQGVRLDKNGNYSNSGKKYYNMYGIGAVDNNAVLGGARYAQQMGWDTPAKAIIGGASFVSQNYFGRGQNTLYSMRWNPNNPGTYQYATDINWAYATATNIKNYYDQLGIKGRYFTRYVF